VPDRPPRRPSASTEPGPDAPVAANAPREMPPAVQPRLARGEQVLVQLRGIGASMFVTSERVIVAREGGERRPRSGVQSFPLDAITLIRLEPGAPPSGRIAVWIGAQEAVSMFFDARSSDQAQEAVDIARPVIARRRRERQAVTRRMSG
jgi:hypothetical protein